MYIDSPLANEATSIFVQTDHSYFDEEMRAILDAGKNPLFFPGLEVAVSAEESKAINFDQEPKVILSASGMCEAGRIRHHLKHNLWREECLILFAGYQAEGTLGRVLYEGAESVKLFGEEIQVNAQIAYLANISGHADKNGLLHWMNAFEKKPEIVFVNHGEDGAMTSFAECLMEEEYGFPWAVAPYSGTSYDLATGAASKDGRRTGARAKNRLRRRKALYAAGGGRQAPDEPDRRIADVEPGCKRLTREIEEVLGGNTDGRMNQQGGEPINYQREMERQIDECTRDGSVPTLLLHSCCGPCSSAVMERLTPFFKVTVFYYNPNIYPEEEYAHRVAEQERLIQCFPQVHPIHFLEGEYDPPEFYERPRRLGGRTGGRREVLSMLPSFG